MFAFTLCGKTTAYSAFDVPVSAALRDLLMNDLRRALTQPQQQSESVHGAESSSFAHGTGAPHAEAVPERIAEDLSDLMAA